MTRQPYTKMKYISLSMFRSCCLDVSKIVENLNLSILRSQSKQGVLFRSIRKTTKSTIVLYGKTLEV